MSNSIAVLLGRFVLFSTLLGLVNGCATTPMIYESYTKEEGEISLSGFGLLVHFNPVGQRHESCEIGEKCWIFGSPYDVYFQVYSPLEHDQEICFEHVEFRLEQEVLYASSLDYCTQFRFSKDKGDYRAYERLPEVDLGFYEGRQVTVLLRTRFNGQPIEHQVVVKASKVGESSSDLLRYIYSI